MAVLGLMRKLLSRWRIALVVLAGVPFLLFATYAAMELDNTQGEVLVTELNRAALVTANAVNLQLGTSVGYLSALATSEAALRSDVPALYAHAQGIMQSMPEAAAISLVGADGKLIFLTLRPLGTRGLPVGEPEVAQKVIATGRPAVSGPFKSPVSDRMVTSVGVPLFQGGKLDYCLRMILQTNALNELLTAQKMPADWTLAIIDTNGVIVARSRRPEAYVGKQTTAVVLEAMRARDTRPVDTRTLEGDGAKVVVIGLPGWDWSIAVAVPTEQFGQRRTRLFQLLALFGGALAAVGAVVVVGMLAQPARDPAATTTPALFKGVWPAMAALLLVVVLGASLALGTQFGLERL